MKRCYLDANLLVFFGDEASLFYKTSTLLIEKLAIEQYRIVVSSLSLDEFIYNSMVLCSGSKKEKLEGVKRVLNNILNLPNIKLVNPPLKPERHLKVIEIMDKFGLKPRDAYHMFTMMENKIKYLATFDHDFDKVFSFGKINKFSL